jgi:hypothetical protein
MARGKKTGGRVKGISLNKKTLADIERRKAGAKKLEEIVAAGDVPDPPGYAKAIWSDPSSSKAEKMQAWKDAAPYMWPRLSNVDLHSKNENVHWHIGDTPLSAEEWLVEVGQDANITGRTVPLATTVGHVHAIELEVRDRKIEMLTAEIEKLKDALLLSQAREAEQRKIPLLS